MWMRVGRGVGDLSRRFLFWDEDLDLCLERDLSRRSTEERDFLSRSPSFSELRPLSLDLGASFNSFAFESRFTERLLERLADLRLPRAPSLLEDELDDELVELEDELDELLLSEELKSLRLCHV